eukprot:6201636-Pleurochrysis_carterae.AAC.1
MLVNSSERVCACGLMCACSCACVRSFPCIPASACLSARTVAKRVFRLHACSCVLLYMGSVTMGACVAVCARASYNA